MSELSRKLRDWEDQWRRQGVSVDDYLAPPTTRERVHEILTNVGLHACEEAVDWFTWHDGARVHPLAFEVAPSPFLPLSLEEATADRDSRREVAVLTASDVRGEGCPELEDPDYYWEPTWLPIARDSGPRVVALELTADARDCPVRVIDPWASGEDSYRQVSAPSLTEAVRLWMEWMEHGGWAWSPDQARWIRNWEAVPLQIRLTGLI